MAKALGATNARVIYDSGLGGERVLLVRCTDVDESDTLDLSAILQRINKAVIINTGGAGIYTVTPGGGATTVTFTTGAALLNDSVWLLVHGTSAVA